MSLIRIEINKIIKNKVICFACILIVLFIILIGIENVRSHGYVEYNNETNELIQLNGLQAISKERNSVKEISCYLDEENLISIINKYQDIAGDNIDLSGNKILNDEQYVKSWIQYQDIQSLIARIYSKPNEFNYYIIGELTTKDAKNFYTERISRINEFLTMDQSNTNNNKVDKDEIIEFASKLNTPMYFTYHDGWNQMIKQSFIFSIIIILGLSFCNCLIFTEDFHNKMIDIVKSTLNGKEVLAKSKILASFIFTTVVFIIFQLFILVFYLLTFGLDGYKCPLQLSAKYWISIYNVSLGNAYLLIILTTYCATIFVSQFTLLISNVVKKSFLTISVILVFFFLPFALNTSSLSPIISNILEIILPVKAIDVTTTFLQNKIYHIGEIRILSGYFIPIILCLLFTIIPMFTIKIYSRKLK